MLTLRFILSAGRKTKDFLSSYNPGDWHKPSRYLSFFFVLLGGSCALGYYKITNDNKLKFHKQ